MVVLIPDTTLAAVGLSFPQMTRPQRKFVFYPPRPLPVCDIIMSGQNLYLGKQTTNAQFMIPCPIFATNVSSHLPSIKSLLLLLLNHHSHGIVQNNLRIPCTPKENDLVIRLSKCTILIKSVLMVSFTVIQPLLRDNTLSL